MFITHLSVSVENKHCFGMQDQLMMKDGLYSKTAKRHKQGKRISVSRCTIPVQGDQLRSARSGIMANICLISEVRTQWHRSRCRSNGSLTMVKCRVVTSYLLCHNKVFFQSRPGSLGVAFTFGVAHSGPTA
jgi:hypothetical protein